MIGGSLGLALRRRGLPVSATDSNYAALKRARRAGALSRAAKSIGEAVKGADVVVLCVPIQEIAKCLRAVSRFAGSNAVITDVASVKVPALAAARKYLYRPERFVGGHPLAGSEKSGVGAARHDLFRRRLCVLVPPRGARREAVTRAKEMWRLAGARIKLMSARKHDSAVARTSHLPHVIAGVLAESILSKKGLAELASGSFLDATRVAVSPARLWREILLYNRAEVRAAVREFGSALGRFGLAIRSGRRKWIGDVLGRAGRMRGRLKAGRGG